LTRTIARKAGDDYTKFATFENQAIKGLNIPGVTIIRNAREAEDAIRVLHKLKMRLGNQGPQLGHGNHRPGH